MGLPCESRIVIVSNGAAVIQVSGGWFLSILGLSGSRQPIAMYAVKKQRTTPIRQRIRALQRPILSQGSAK